MNTYQTEKSAATKVWAAMFDHEKLDAYQFELRFIAWVTPLLEEVSASAKGKTREVCDQLDRASLSALLNTAEGNGKRQRPVRAKFFDDARGSATECAACLDALVAKQVATEQRILDGKKMLVRIVSMLCGLVDRFDVPGQLHEDPTEYRVGDQEKCESRTRARTRTRRTKI
ncbi:MAG: four helix bundle protein [Limisphaerales bacterium]